MNSRKIGEAEFRRDWQLLHGQVFRHAFLIDFFWLDIETPFADAGWEMALMPHQLLHAAYATFHEKHRNPDYYPLSSDYDAWPPFFRTLRDIDDLVFIVMQSWEGGEFPSVLGDEYVYNVDGEYDGRNAGIGLSCTFSAAFGQSGRWGALCDDLEMTLIGGDAEFMGLLKKHSGGLPKIQERYSAFAPDLWWSNREVEVYKILCRKIGWPEPKVD
jgi:hypothetical protein